jgi:cytochrome b pre-mRNA-processing protein 3
MLQTLFKARPQKTKGERLYASAVAQARRPELYAGLGAPDRLDARFELYTAHVVLVLARLKGAGEEAGEVSQAMFDAYLKALDDALRELGVGDLSVARKMRKLGATIYDRTRALGDALAPDAAPGALEGVLAPAVFGEDAGSARAAALAAYIREARDALAGQPLAQVLDGDLKWPKIAS